MSIELKPCPFCGADPHDARHIEYGRWAVTCRCGASGVGANTGPNATDAAKIKAYQDARTAWNTRTAIQQAEAQQPVTPEPVAWLSTDSIGERYLCFAKPFDDPDAKPLVHPAPSVLDDSKRLDYLQDRGATIDLIAGVADFYPMRFRVGGLHSSANIDVRAAIDAAMLAGKTGGEA